MSERGGKPVQAFFGFLLVTIGLLMATLCGLCTGVFVISGLASNGGEYGGLGLVATALVIGGLPTLLGVGLFFAGRRLLRGAEPPKPIVRLDDAP
jgi:hypothetical protein